MNSLAEVGVGVNLAFSMIRGIRDGLSGLFSRKLNTQKETVQARLNELGKQNGGVSKLAVRVDDIWQKYEKYGQRMSVFAVVTAMLSAFSLVIFLYESSLSPSQEVGNVYAFISLCLVIGPLSYALLAQLGLYTFARFFLWLRLKRYDIYAKVVSESESTIEPKPPTY